MLGSIFLTIDRYPLKAILATDEYGAAISVQVPSMRGARDVSARELDEDLLTMSAIGHCGDQVLLLGWKSKIYGSVLLVVDEDLRGVPLKLNESVLGTSS